MFWDKKEKIDKQKLKAMDDKRILKENREFEKMFNSIPRVTRAEEKQATKEFIKVLRNDKHFKDFIPGFFSNEEMKGGKK
jgi:hypothetical protein